MTKTQEQRSELAAAVKRLRVEVLNVDQDEFTALLGVDNPGTASKYQNQGPTVGALPRLAKLAQDAGADDLKQIFMDAFYAEYPDLMVLAVSTTPQNTELIPGNVGAVQHKKDVHSIAGDLYEMLDELVSMGEPAITWARESLTSALMDARISERRKKLRQHGTGS